MTEYEASLLKDIIDTEPRVPISCLLQGYEGTLVYGYTCDRDTFHLYVKDGIFHRIIYFNRGDDYELVSHNTFEEIPMDMCIPDKRIYRQESQYFFLRLLVQYGGPHLSLTESNMPEDYTIKLGEFVERAKLIEDF